MDYQEPSTGQKIARAVKKTVGDTQNDLRQVHYHNRQTFRRDPLSEISGSFGDLGTLLPLLIALTAQRSISLSSTLVFSGLANILTGVLFGIPLPVQPMKAIAAVAIVRNFTLGETMGAGLFVAGAIGLLSVTGSIKWFTGVVPVPIVKGIQVGTGLSLIIQAGTIYNVHIPENNWIVLIAFLALLVSTTALKRVPYALLVLIIGTLVVFVLHPSAAHEEYSTPTVMTHRPVDEDSESLFGFWQPHIHVPSLKQFIEGTVQAGIGQLPLTTLNSVIAVCFLAAELFPANAPPTPSTTALGLSVAVINLVGCFFGAMPVCHGSGGLAAQYRFGARSGASVIFLGLVKLVLGLFASRAAEMLFIEFPRALLCVLLLAAGLELAKVGESVNAPTAPDLSRTIITADDVVTGMNSTRGGLDHGSNNSNGISSESPSATSSADPLDPVFLVDLTDEERKRRYTTMFMTVAGILAFKNDAIGFVAGMLCHLSFRWEDQWEERMWRGRIRLEGASTGRGREREREEGALESGPS